MTSAKLTKTVLASALVFASAAALPTAAFAQDAGWYLGGAVGQSKFDINRGEPAAGFTAAGLTTTGITTDENDTGWKLFGGYKINKYFGVEGTYVDLGKFSASTTITAGLPGVPLGFTASAKAKDGLYISAVGTWPVTTDFSVFGKLGVYSIKTTVTASVAGISVGDSSRDENVTLGAGVGYNFTKNLGIRGEWERFNKVGNKDKTGEADVDLLSIGLVYKF